MTTAQSSLKNGMRVVSHAMRELETVTVGVWVDAGSRHEEASQNGLSHVLEHMAFKGTTTRSARHIAQEIEQVGGYLNAYTSREQTAYYARVLKADLPLALDLLADILQHSTFEPGELERERGVIVQEIGQALDTPEDVVFDLLQEAAYPDQPIGRTILGSVERVQAFDRRALLNYMDVHYRAPSMVVAAAGALDHEGLVQAVEDRFVALSPARPRALDPGCYRGGERRQEKPLEQVHVALALDGVTYTDPDYFTCQVYVNALGGGMSSRLFQEVREVRGLCYSIYAFANAYVDTGLIGLYAGTAEEDVAELMPVVIDQMAAMATDCSEEEVARARAQLKAGLLMSLESSSARTEQIARQMLLFDRPLALEELTARIDAVDGAAVRAFADRVMRRGGPTLAAVGPCRGLAARDAIALRFG